MDILNQLLKKIEDNQEKTKSLISFLENNSTDNEEFNTLSKDMLCMLNDMKYNLDMAYAEYKTQYKLDISDSNKLDNLHGGPNYFSNKNELFAYDYIAKYNDRVEKVIKIYNQMKEL